MYYNKNDYFNLLRTTQYSGGYIRWIKFFVNAIGETTKQSAELLMQYESIISEDEYHLKENWNYLSTQYQKHLICCKNMELLNIMIILSEIEFLDMLSWKN